MADVQAGTDTARVRRDARLTLFGSAPRAAMVEVTPRPRSRRMARALATAAASLVVAAIAGIIPPHAPWILGVLAIGAWRARAEWRGEYALHAFDGECPRCGAGLEIGDRYVTPPVTVVCYGCHAQPQLLIDGRGAAGDQDAGISS